MVKNRINLALFWPRYNEATTSLNDLVVGLDKEHFNVIFIYLTGFGVEKNLMEDAGYKVFYLSNIESINTFRFSILFRLIKVLKENNIDILHCQRHKASFYGAIAGILAKTPVVLSHVHGLSRTRTLGRRIFNFILFKRFNKIIGCTESVCDDVLKNNPSVSRKKVIALENSIDFKRFTDEAITKDYARKQLELPVDALVFGTVGRLAPTKGQFYLIQAFAEVKRHFSESQLLIVGTGNLKSELQKQADETGFGESIHFLDQRDDVQKILKSLDVFVFPSVAEGFGLALVEAMATGIPCIATEVGGIPEVTNGTNTCVLVKPKDSTELTRAMIKVVSMPKNELAQLVHKAQNRVRNFYSHDVVSHKLANLYENEIRACSRT